MTGNTTKHIIERLSDDPQPVYIQGGNSKAFYGRKVSAEALDMSGHNGIISYEPSELVVTVRTGTPLKELIATLAEHKQMLPFEPPQFSDKSTIGGAIASGLAGVSRPWRSAPRDALLGAHIIDGKAQPLTFGGQVMKNVAGYDVSRLMAGAHGTLGILMNVSVKLMPLPISEKSFIINTSRKESEVLFKQWAQQNTAITAACFIDNTLHIRLSGHPESVKAMLQKLPQGTEEDLQFWQQLNDHQLQQRDTTYWRLSVPPATPRLACEPDNSIVDWAGAQRWFHSDLPANEIRQQVEVAGGHATLFNHQGSESKPFQPISDALKKYQKNLKAKFDPENKLNPGRIYTDL